MGKVTVIRVEQNVNKVSKAGKPYSTTEFEYQPDPYQGVAKGVVVKNIFDTHPAHAKIIALAKGDYVNLVNVQNGQHWEITDVQVLNGAGVAGGEAPPAAVAGSNTNGATPGYSGGDSLRRSADEMRRSASVGICASLLKGTVKATTKPEEAIRMVISNAPTIEAYLKGEATPEEIDELTKDSFDE